jgi:hypothetical protein
MAKPVANRCKYICEKRFKHQRYVYARWQCGNRAMKGKSYCWQHKQSEPL